MLPPVDKKTKRFVAETFNDYFLKHGDDEVTMTLSETGVELKKGTTTIDAPVWTTLKLYKTAAGNEQAPDNTQISLSAIEMERTWNAKASYTNPVADAYKMKVSVTEYYEADKTTSTIPTVTDADQQKVRFIFPEEKTDGSEDGGIHIRYFFKIIEKINIFTKNNFQDLNMMVQMTRILISIKTNPKFLYHF